eukprot:TRINITY_DN1619_c0_g1_i2.p1 TRINITY_DN1619_c0_g1~~TRINITY_DN1619_c0_g1_i2.p1  ORF type:complete len:777 (+),score=111.87 TRINITY_DN1619_c0_g1_i2:641-2971(+)
MSFLLFIVQLCNLTKLALYYCSVKISFRYAWNYCHLLINLLDKGNIQVFKKQRSEWIADDAVSECMNCQSQFSLFFRRHHCRACGLIYCQQCSSQFVPLPDLQGHFPNEPDTVYFMAKQSLTDWVYGSKGEKCVRVCDGCYKLYGVFSKFEEDTLNLPLIQTLSPSIVSHIFNMMNLDIYTLWTASAVCKCWNQAASLRLASFRHIQYYLPTREISEEEKRLLWQNRHIIKNHSRYFLRFLLSVDWNDNHESGIAFQLLYSRPEHKNISHVQHKKECWSLMCTRLCQPLMSIEEAIQLLGSKIPIPRIRQLALDIFDYLDDEELSYYLPILVFYIRYDRAEFPETASFLIKRALQDEKIRNDLHWLILIHLQDDKSRLYSTVSNEFKKAVRTQLDHESMVQLQRGQEFVDSLQYFRELMREKDLDCKSEYTKDKLRSYVRQSGCFDSHDTPLNIPVSPWIKSYALDYDSLSVKTSATLPIVIKCKHQNEYGEEQKPFAILYKSEDVRKDMIIVNIIKIMDGILKKEEDLDLNIITYRVLPTGIDDGIIQIVPDADTIYSIENDQKQTIQNWILEHNKDSTSGDIRDTFIKSTAAYCVITYLLGIGDRHLHNIMVTESGVLFHIDFGFILGQDPKVMAPYMRLTESMVNAIGGEHSERYAQFKEYCLQAYNCLRRHASLFLTLLLLIAESSPQIDCEGSHFTAEQIEAMIMRRFIPGQSNSEARQQLFTRLHTSKDGYAMSIHDIMHSISTEDTIRATVNTIGSSVWTIATSLIGSN